MFAVKRLRRTDMPPHAQHRHLIERKQKLRRAARAAENTAGIRRERMAAEYAAEIRRARMMAQHAACRLRPFGRHCGYDRKHGSAYKCEKSCIRPPSLEGGGQRTSFCCRRQSGVG